MQSISNLKLYSFANSFVNATPPVGNGATVTKIELEHVMDELNTWAGESPGFQILYEIFNKTCSSLTVALQI